MATEIKRLTRDEIKKVSIETLWADLAIQQSYNYLVEVDLMKEKAFLEMLKLGMVSISKSQIAAAQIAEAAGKKAPVYNYFYVNVNYGDKRKLPLKIKCSGRLFYAEIWPKQDLKKPVIADAVTVMIAEQAVYEKALIKEIARVYELLNPGQKAPKIVNPYDKSTL
jgi:hypothetical protein